MAIACYVCGENHKAVDCPCGHHRTGKADTITKGGGETHPYGGSKGGWAPGKGDYGAYGKGEGKRMGKGNDSGYQKGQWTSKGESGRKGKSGRKGGGKGRSKGKGNGWVSNKPCLDFFGTGSCPREGDCKWSHMPPCKHGPECAQGDYCRFTHDWDNLLGTWYAEEGSVQPESEPRGESEGSQTRGVSGGAAADGGQQPTENRTATLTCQQCGKEAVLKGLDIDDENKQKCTACEKPMAMVKMKWKAAT